MEIKIYERPAVSPSEEDSRIACMEAHLTGLGIQVFHYDPFADPDAFETNEILKELMADQGLAVLPAFFVDSRLMSWGAYPENDEIMAWISEGPACGGCPAGKEKGCCARCGGQHA